MHLNRGKKPDPHVVQTALLSSTIGCDEQPVPDCRRVLAGRLNVAGAMSQIIRGLSAMSEPNETQEDPQTRTSENTPFATPAVQPAQVQAATPESGKPEVFKGTQPLVSTAISQRKEIPEPQGSVAPSNITAAACECGTTGGAPPQLVFAIGQLGFDFGTEARRDSIMQHMKPPAIPHDPVQLLAYLKDNPWDAAAILWTLNLDATPIYAIQGQGGFASEAYERIRAFLEEQTKGEVERVSIPGYIGGSARLFTGQVVPVNWPVLRGMYSWNTRALVEAVCGAPPAEKAPQKEKDEYSRKVEGVTNFLRRVYEELRNLGITPQERAINYSATNAFQVTEVFKDAIKEEMDLDTIEVVRSPICRPDSDCWDVKLTFFNPKKVFEQARKVYLFTVDVSDVVPVMVGPVRSWFVR
ncbi:MAG: PatA/PatG family cyanobactin maturation protease [Gammaproteobacteria bacterium]